MVNQEGSLIKIKACQSLDPIRPFCSPASIKPTIFFALGLALVSTCIGGAVKGEVFYVIVISMILKLLVQLRHFLSLLIMVEAVLIISFFFMNTLLVSSASGPTIAFILIVIMVMGACIGLSIIVVVSRSFSKRLEIAKLKL